MGWTGPVAPGCLGGSALSTAADWMLGLHFPGPGVALGGCWAWLGPASGRDPYQQGVGTASAQGTTGQRSRCGSLSSGPLYPWLWKVCIGRRWCKSLLFRHFPESGILTREGCGLSLIQQSVPLISSAWVPLPNQLINVNSVARMIYLLSGTISTRYYISVSVSVYISTDIYTYKCILIYSIVITLCSKCIYVFLLIKNDSTGLSAI